MITLHIIAVVLYVIACLGFGLLGWIYMEALPFVHFSKSEVWTVVLLLTFAWPLVMVILFILGVIEYIKER